MAQFESFFFYKAMAQCGQLFLPQGYGIQPISNLFNFLSNVSRPFTSSSTSDTCV